jgi:hypothetical protein
MVGKNGRMEGWKIGRVEEWKDGGQTGFGFIGRNLEIRKAGRWRLWGGAEGGGRTHTKTRRGVRIEDWRLKIGRLAQRRQERKGG